MPLTPSELLKQATCAVLVDGQVKGTAWLCTTEGHLLTAGHLLGKQEPLEAVEVRFLDDAPQTATRISWGYQEHMGVDFAVLKLEKSSTDRQPLPMSFEKEVEGSFKLYGFGVTLHDLSAGIGNFVGSLEVQNNSEFQLFRLNSQEVGERGYSGGAVYSDDLQAVVGIQVESVPEHNTVLAMPLHRIPHVWDPDSGLRPPGNTDRTTTYLYHILLSYERSVGLQKWVEEFFVPELKTWLEQELDDGPEIFWNHDNLREGWTRPMVDAVRRSRYLVILQTPKYARSLLCLAELESFSQREQMERTKLSRTILWHGEAHKALDDRPLDFRDFAYIAEGYKRTEEYVQFQRSVKHLAADLKSLIEDAPPCQTHWPVVAPAEVRTKIPSKPHISKPCL